MSARLQCHGPAALALAGLVIAGCFGGEDTTPVVQELTLSAGADDDDYLAALSESGPSHWDRMQALRDAADKAHVKGLLLRVGPLGGSWARTAEMADALAQVRKAGKPVHCHVENTDNVGYTLLATACDRISMTPAGSLDLVGVRAQAIYAKPLLDRLGITAELLQAGKYKGAADALTQEDMPDTTREALDAILDALHAHLLQAMEQGRSITGPRAQRILDAGPYTAHRAHLEGLVDDVGFDDEARQHARKAAGVDKLVELEPGPKAAHGLGALLEALMQAPEQEPSQPYIALVQLEGTITSEGHGAGAAAAFVPKLRKLADHEACKAVVLRIDSPGGSALASDRMWHAVRRVSNKKPVIVSVGDMAASGGYYIASAGTHIMAQPVSLVGSIGVVGGKISVAGTADKLGVRAVTLRRGQNAAWASPLTLLSDSERAALRGLIDATYRIFLKRVGSGRKLSPEAVAAMAEGRLMTATRGREGGLLDSDGGLLQAVAMAREQAKLDDDAPIVAWPPPRGPLEALLGGEVRAALSPGGAAHELAALFDKGRVLGPLSPLLAGEHSVAALPYRLLLR